MELGIIGAIILALNILAIYSIVTSGASTGAKLLWIILILVLPLLGLILWFFLGPRGSRVGA